MLRAIVLSLALLIGIGTLIPLATEFAEASSSKQRKYKKKKVKKYSKRWWRAYNKRKAVKRARVRRAKRARIARVRKARISRARVAKQRNPVVRTRSNNATTESYAKTITPKTTSDSKSMIPVVLPSGDPAPKTWKSEGITQGELQFSVTNNNGSPIGAASISIIGPASEDSMETGNRAKTVGGVATTALRRTVIDQMIKENGWVVNDFQKEIGGKKVYVVIAQAPGANNQVENRTFYFTEAEGKIYSVATKSGETSSEKFEEESEKVINSLQRKTLPAQVASNRTVSNLVANEE
jgi:hypothetical protein